MIIRALKSFSPSIVILIAIMGVLLNLPSWFLMESLPIDLADNTIVYQTLTRWFVQSPSHYLIAGLIYLFIVASLLHQLNQKFILIRERTYLPSFFMVLIIGSFSFFHGLNAVLLSIPFIILSINSLFTAYVNKGVATQFFDAAFLLSMAALIYPSALYLGISVWIALSIFRPFIWREWIYSILGLISPFVIVFSLLFLTNNNVASWMDETFYDVWRFSLTSNIKFNSYDYFILIIEALLLVFALLYILSTLNTRKAQTRKYFLLLIWIFMLILMVMFITPKNNPEMLIYLTVPASIIMANYYSSIRKRLIWANLGLIFIFIALIFNYLDKFNIFSLIKFVNSYL